MYSDGLQVRTMICRPRRRRGRACVGGMDAVGVGVGEGVVEEDGEAAVVVGGEDFGDGEADGGGDLFAGAAAEGGEAEGGIAGADEFEAVDAGVG